MKKLSFLMALILILSSLSIAPVFAATEYSYTGATSTSTTQTFAIYSSTPSGLTYDYNVAGPQKASSDTVYHVYGTSTINDANWYKYVFNKSLSSDVDFNTKNSYTYSIDMYFPAASDSDTKSEIAINMGITGKVEGATSTTSKTMNLVFRTGSFSSTDDYYNNSTAIFYGLEKDRWHNVVIDVSFDGTDLSFDVYIDGVLAAEHYRWTSTNGSYSVSGGTVAPSAFATALVEWYLVARSTLKFVTGEKHNFYFDNVIYKSDVSYAGDTVATIEAASNGVVTVEDTATIDTIKELATGESTVEIYRANESAANGYTEVTDTFATGDIVKLVTANGSYSYYTLNVNEATEPTNPFAIGELTAPTLNPSANDTVSASLALSGDTSDKNVTLVLCLYKGITLVEMVTDTISNGDAVRNLTQSVTVPNEAGNYTAKAFVWDSLTKMGMLK